MAAAAARTSLKVAAAQWLTRAHHRLLDGADIVAFSCCPFDSWSTSLILSATKHIHIEQKTSLGSGGFVWNGARRLAAHLQRHGDGVQARSSDHPHGATHAIAGRPWLGLNVLELGAGTGALGLAVSVLGGNVTLTDQAAFVYPGNVRRTVESAQTASAVGERRALQTTSSLLDLLHTNANRNRQLATSDQAVVVREMVWGGDRAMLGRLPHATYDVIVAADVLLFECAQEDLLSTLRSVSNAQTVIMIEHTDRSGGLGEAYPSDLLNFLELLAKDTNVRWIPTIVRDYGRHLTLRIERDPTRGGVLRSTQFTVHSLAARRSSFYTNRLDED